MANLINSIFNLSELFIFKQKRFYQLPFKRLTCLTEVECFHDPIFLAGESHLTMNQLVFCFGQIILSIEGRYLKHSRTLSQTAWIVDGERVWNINSIEEILSNVLKKELSATGDLNSLINKWPTTLNKLIFRGCIRFIWPGRHWRQMSGKRCMFSYWKIQPQKSQLNLF